MSIRLANLFKSRGAIAFAAFAALLFANAEPCAADGYPSKFTFGEAALEAEIAKVAIAIPADGAGLPPGRGDYETGKQLYANACAACHGDKLEGVAGLPNMPSGASLRLIGGRGTLTSQKPTV